MFFLMRLLSGNAKSKNQLDGDKAKLENVSANNKIISELDNSAMNISGENISKYSNTDEEASESDSGNSFEEIGIIDYNKSDKKMVDSSILKENQKYRKKNPCCINMVAVENLQKGDDLKLVPNMNLKNAVEALKLEKPTYFKSQRRLMPGMITQRTKGSIEIDTDSGLLSVDLDNVELCYTPRTGDRILVECNVSSEENSMHHLGEILDVVKVVPFRIESKQRSVVDRVYAELVILSDNAFVLKDDIPSGIVLHLDDIVLVDLIECEYFKCSRRAIKLELLPTNFGMKKKFIVPNIHGQSRNLAISFNGDRAFFTELWKKYTVIIKTKNNLSRLVLLVSIHVHGKKDGHFKLLEPRDATPIRSGEELPLTFEVSTKYYGEFKENFTITFDKFKVTRSFMIVVADSEKSVEIAKARLTAVDYMTMPGKSMDQRNRLYANKVWSVKMDVVPGEFFLPKRRFVALRLNQYEVPEKLQEIFFTFEPRNQMIQCLEQEYPSITGPLTIENYRQRFTMFLHLDEITNFSIFRGYDIERGHFQRDSNYLSLHIENLSERRPSLVIGDMVHAIAITDEKGMNMDRKFEGIIHKVLFNRILLKFNQQFHEEYKNEDYRLEFYFSRFPFRKQHFAISRIVGLMGEEFLFPKKLIKRKNVQLDLKLTDNYEMYLYDSKVNWFNNSLNSIQKQAIFNILRGETKNMPYVIFGPPGTGKTITLLETILQLVHNLPGSRLLVSTPSNSAADLITQHLIDSNIVEKDTIIRLVSHHQIENRLIPEPLTKYCATVDISTMGTCNEGMDVTTSGLKLRCQAEYLGRQRVTISTCMTLGNLLQMEFPPGHFTHVLIDEAGQCTETETITPIVLLSKHPNQVILAGDPHQLSPIIINHLAVERGFTLSFLERILQHYPYSKDMVRFPDTSGYNPCVVTKLLYSYRALPSIVNLYSEIFYDNELIAKISDRDSPQAKLLEKVQKIFLPDLHMPRSHGVVFLGVIGENMQDNDSPSWFNSEEAREILMLTLSLYRLDVNPDQMGILTPYIKQVKVLRAMFDDTGVTIPKIGSVEEFQGQERDIMLISTVRSTVSMLPNDSRLGLGFVGNTKRINVAISRARTLMIIIGNPYLLSIETCWRQLIVYCAQNNSYYGCELPKEIFKNSKSSDNDENLDNNCDDGNELSESEEDYVL